MKHLASPASLFLLALAGPAFALQDADAAAAPPVPAPAAELGVYAPFIGTWSGSGTVTPEPGAEALAWTGAGEHRWVVGGHAMLESMRVEMTGQDIPPFEWTNLHAYDAEAKALVSAGAGSMGGFTSSDAVFVVGEGTVVTAQSGMDEGKAVIDQVIWSAKGDSMTIKIHRAIGDGAPYEYVKGSFKRTTPDAGTIAAAAPRGAPLAPELRPLAPMIGQWTLAGTWRPSPEAPEMEVVGHDTFTPIAGGAAILGESKGGEKGGPLFYESIAIMGWDAERGVIRQVGADNMGGAGQVDQHVQADGSVVSTHAGVEAGVPYADSGVMHFADGKLKSVKAMRLMGDEAFTAFEGRYTSER